MLRTNEVIQKLILKNIPVEGKLDLLLAYSSFRPQNSTFGIWKESCLCKYIKNAFEICKTYNGNSNIQLMNLVVAATNKSLCPSNCFSPSEIGL